MAVRRSKHHRPSSTTTIVPSGTKAEKHRSGSKSRRLVTRRPIISAHWFSQAHNAWKIEYSEQLADGKTWWTSAIYCSDEQIASMIATVAAKVKHKGQWDELAERVKLIAKEMKAGFLYRIMEGGKIETFKGKEEYRPGGYYAVG